MCVRVREGERERGREGEREREREREREGGRQAVESDRGGRGRSVMSPEGRAALTIFLTLICFGLFLAFCKYFCRNTPVTCERSAPPARALPLCTAPAAR